MKDLEKLLFAYISIAVSIDDCDKLLYFLDGYFFYALHILKSIGDEIEHFTCVQGTTIINIVGLEYFLNCEAKVIIIAHNSLRTDINNYRQSALLN